MCIGDALADVPVGRAGAGSRGVAFQSVDREATVWASTFQLVDMARETATRALSTFHEVERLALTRARTFHRVERETPAAVAALRTSAPFCDDVGAVPIVIE